MIPTNLNLKLIRELNKEGKNSNVFVMYDSQLNTELVVKRIAKKDFKNPDEYFEESSILYEVEHPNVVRIQHATDDKDYVYLSMPFHSNGSIEYLINRRFLTVGEVIEYSLNFLNGLHYVHTKGLIHFDVKPTNILIHDNGKAILTDFGLSKFVNASGLSFPDKIYPFHMPPEIIEGLKLSNKSDIYQAGMTLYRMCNGNEMYKNQTAKYKNIQSFKDAILRGKFPNRKNFLPHIPKKLRKIIKKALNVNPDSRYPTVLDMVNEISTIDKNLNIVYSMNKNTCSEKWEYSSSKTHINRITLYQNNKLWHTKGEKIRFRDNNISCMHNFQSGGHTNRKDGLDQVKKFLNNL